MNPHVTESKRNTACYINALLRPARIVTRMADMPLPGSMPGPVPHLYSRFALDQLSEVARRCVEPEFVMMMASIFGYDLPPETYIKLQQALINGNFENPVHQLDHSAAYPADYDNEHRTLNIHPQAFDELLRAPERNWELLAILLHEFGHHVDNVLRHDLAENEPDGSRPARDAEHEEGSRYARAMARYEATQEGKVSIARYTPADADGADIFVDYQQAMQAVARFQSESAQGAVEGEREHFEAGNDEDHKDGHFSHETIARNLKKLGFDTRELATIYFGNWLRDYSQLVDPKLVRAPDMPPGFPNVLSRKALTKIVDVMAARKFNEQREVYRELFTVTEDKLGVYLPSEHIDNPKVTGSNPLDPQTRDPDFEPLVLPGDPLLEVDYRSSMKRYIHRSRDNMRNELRTAMRERRTGPGLQGLGAALHVLEDFFAHSNFVELSLIKLGYKEVLPWTSKADCEQGLPLVTGMFSGPDVIASLAYPVAKAIAPIKAWEFKRSDVGQRSDTEKMLLILLGEHEREDWLALYEKYLAARDEWRKYPWTAAIERLFWSKNAPLMLVENAYGAIFQGVLKLVGNAVDDFQTALGEDPNTSGSTDPSHSQLAKDHAEHPLHELAATLAQEAVMKVAKAMVDHWDPKFDADPSEVASTYFVHAYDTQWQDEIVARWAEQNPKAIHRAGLKSELDQINKNMRETAKEKWAGFRNEGMTSWQYTLNLIAKYVGIKDNAGKQDKNFDIKDIGKFVIKNS